MNHDDHIDTIGNILVIGNRTYAMTSCGATVEILLLPTTIGEQDAYLIGLNNQREQLRDPGTVSN